MCDAGLLLASANQNNCAMHNQQHERKPYKKPAQTITNSQRPDPHSKRELNIKESMQEALLL